MVQRLIRSKMFDKYRYQGMLYAVEPVMKTCRNNGWQYIMRLKEDRLKLLGEEIKGLEKVEIEGTEIRYCNEIKYDEVQREKQANVLKYYEKEK